MGPLIAGLAGVVLGAGLTLVIVLILLQRRADRDLIERRLRALLEYRECLGGLERWLVGNHAGEPGATEQVATNLDSLAREYRLTAWLFDDPLRKEIGRGVERAERAVRRFRNNGRSDSRESLPALLAACQRLDRELRRAVARTLREHRRLRFLPQLGRSASSASPALEEKEIIGSGERTR